MEKYPFDSFEKSEAKVKELANLGYQETVTVENVPIGACSGKLVLVSSGEGENKTLKPVITVVTFERVNDKSETLLLTFTAVTMNVLHLSSGSSYNE